MPERKLRVAVVGCGTQSQLAHIPALKQNPSVELVALCDTDDAKLRGDWSAIGDQTSALPSRLDAAPCPPQPAAV